MKNKGFTMVELLAVIAILGIMTGLAMAAYTRYKDSTREKGYDIMANSAISGAESYIIENPTATEVNFDTLVDRGYLEDTRDPADSNNNCTGTVRISKQASPDPEKLSENSFVVDLCCSNVSYQYSSNGRKAKTTLCQANFNEEKYIQRDESKCIADNLKSKKFSIYTMDYKNKVCTKGSNGRYGSCYDGNNPYGNTNYPCRQYQYYQFSCKCYYTKDENKFCKSEIVGHSSHIMKIKYLENNDGINACKSDTPGYFNSYVHDVCWEGRYKNDSDVMTFHGYQFFKGKSSGYTDFRPEGTWFHDNISGISLEDRVQRKNDKIEGDKVVPNEEQGCRDTCVRFTEAISKISR